MQQAIWREPRQKSRARRDRLATALRHFGLTDCFGLMALVTGANAPTATAIRRRLARFPDGLPPGVTADYLARFIAAELQGDDTAPQPDVPTLTAGDRATLLAIPSGRPTADAYHEHIYRVLTGIFAGRLVEGKKEAKHESGRKRIDIRFRNADAHGFFADLRAHPTINAPYVVIECKNYSDDPANPEFDQLAGRLKPTIGNFGILCVRQIEQLHLMEQRRLDRRASQHYILVLEDDDVGTMLTAHLADDNAAVDAVLRRRFEPVLFN